MIITVYGKPITQGSKTKTRWGMRDSNGDTLKPWRDNVRSAALEVYNYSGNPFGGDPVNVNIYFTFARPTNHYGTGRNKAFVKASAPPFPSSHAIGDIDKLARACLDALTDAGIWKDDSQVVDLHARKVWVGEVLALDRPGAVIDVMSSDIRSESYARAADVPGVAARVAREVAS